MSSRKIKICAESECKNAATVTGYCRLHYLKNWKNIKEEKKKKAVDRLNRYVEGIVKQHPDRYIDVIRHDLKSRKELDFDGGGTASPSEVDEILDDLGYTDEDGIDKLLTHIKLDRDF
ncbi:MAG: hypothetical protein HYW02_00115 [Deltaproteobacteria bacterium]|nr:hypothetical protein [Deltaproteobacteria bacterium]MBI2499892.1 hypothetical protein [Deltaproteobacteria bacterium]MBI4196251.1 hypothetical protein [Deltaproteobacteria bacterium]